MERRRKKRKRREWGWRVVSVCVCVCVRSVCELHRSPVIAKESLGFPEEQEVLAPGEVVLVVKEEEKKKSSPVDRAKAVFEKTDDKTKAAVAEGV